MKRILLSALALALTNGLSAQTHFSADFNNLDLSAWTNIDNDADAPPASGQNYDIWYATDFSTSFPTLGAGSAVSRSWANNVAYTPDNILISPMIDLTAVPATGLTLLFKAGTIEGSPFHQEHYAVYVTTGNTLGDVTSATAVYETTLATPAAMGDVTVDLTAFVGQQVYIAFRHFMTNDMNTLILDDVQVKTLQPNDAAIAAVNVARYAALSSNNTLSVSVKNEGSNAITSLDIDWNDGTAHSATITTNIAPGATATVNHPVSVSAATVVEKNIAVSINQVNAAADPIMTNNAGAAKFNTVSAIVDKKVVIEEGTGTWCGWCPRGAVAMEYMYDLTKNTHDFIGIAVHNGDPMTVTEYDNGADISGFPGANVDRALLGVSVSKTAFEGYYNDRKDMVVPASLASTFSVNGSALTVNTSATFKTNFSAANYRLAVVLYEENVRGTGSQYNQVNYYSSTSQNLDLIDLSGQNYKNLPNPIPAAQMVYDHVGRALLGGYAGQAGSVPATITDGQTASFSFNYTVPSTQKRGEMHAVSMLIDQATGEIVNAESIALTSAGLDQIAETINMEIYPNPATEAVKVSFEANGGDYEVTIYNMQGKIISTRNLTSLSGAQVVEIPLNNLTAGNYLVSVATKGASFTQNLIVK